MKFYPDSLFFVVIRNIFTSNSAIFAACLDLEVDKGLINYEQNVFENNSIYFYARDGVGAGSVVMINGLSLVIIAKNNYYLGNYGYLEGD